VLNIDGASKGNPGNLGIGGVNRKFNGSFEAAFAEDIGYSDLQLR
jgi:ribonuclease HI